MLAKPQQVNFSLGILLQTSTLFLVTFVFFLVVIFKLNAVFLQQESIQTLQLMISENMNGIQAISDRSICINSSNLILVTAANGAYCNLSLPISDYTPSSSLVYIDWVAALQDKINRNIINYNAICFDTIVVHVLTNNPAIMFPTSSIIPNDPFINGLPHMCVPGSNVGHNGISSAFQDFVNSFLSNINMFTEVPPVNQILYYPPSSITAAVGTSFYMGNDIINCYKTELYCYGYTPVYMYLASN